MSDQSNATFSTTETPPPSNTPEARTPTGEIKDLASTTTSSTTPESASDKPESTPEPKTDTKPSGAPDKYDLKTAEGSPALDPRTVEEFTPIARELGLDNAQAQRLVDFYNKQMAKLTSSEAHVAVIQAQNEKYMTALQSDREIGGKLDQVKADIGRAYDAIGKPELVSAFKAAMAESPEGNNPAFVKMIYAFAQKVNEGKPVSGGRPSPHGQTETGQNNRPTIAEAIYPNLVKH